MGEKDTSSDAKAAQLQLEHVAAAMPASKANENLGFRDFWENRRVLTFCKSSIHVYAILSNNLGFIIYLLPINFGYEVSMMGKLLAVTPFAQRFGYQVEEQFVVKATDQQILNAANTIGIFVSAFMTGIVSDWIGRKKTIIIACIVCIGGVILQYFSTSIMMLFGGKVISTLGFGLGHSLGPVFVAELAPVQMRGLCLALVVGLPLWNTYSMELTL